MISAKSVFLIILTFISSYLCFHRKENRRLPDHRVNTRVYSSIRRFIPKDYVIIDQADGDLNGDGLIDKILVLKLKREITEEEKRPVLLLIRQKDNSFRKVAENDNIVLSLSDGGVHGDPYHGVTIKKGFFSVEHFGGSGWRWNQVITFKYDKNLKNWYLFKIGNGYWHINYPLNYKSNQQTKHDFGAVTFINYKNKWREKD